MSHKTDRVIAEILQKRDRFTKTFRTENHGGAAVIYGYPVHYKEGEAWKEIDNRLEKTESGYQNHASRVKVHFAESSNTIEMVTIEKTGRKLSWGFLAEKQKKQNIRSQAAVQAQKREAVFQPENLYPTEEGMQNRAAVQKTEEKSVEQENQEKMSVPGLVATGHYAEIAEDVDLEYKIIGEQVKENLILKSVEATALEYSFSLQFPGMMIVIREDGGIDLIDEETEEVFYYFAPPCMYDAAGNYSEQVHYELETDAEQHCSILSVVPDQKWLQDENRVYPVVIDPSAETSKTNKAIDDTFVREKSPDSAVVASYGSFTVGHNREYGKCRSFLKFTSLPAMEPGAVIYDAKIYVWQYRYSSDSNQPFFITAHKVTGGWNPGSTTWNNQPAYQSNVLDYCSVKQVQSGNTITVTPCGFNVTKLVREWYNTGVNHGIVITAQNETPYQEAVFISSDYPSNNSYGITSEYFPQGIFYYRSTTGLEDYYSYHEQDAGRAGHGYVNDFNGNLVWVHEDASTSGGLLPIHIRHVYNLSERSKNNRMGKGWRMNFIQEMEATGNANFPYVYTDGDGTRHYFYKDTADGNKLKDEDGLGYELTQTSSSNGDSYYIMKDKNGWEYAFGQDKYMRSIKDSNGNLQKAQYGPSTAGNYLAYLIDPTGARMDFGYGKNNNLGNLNANGRSIYFTYDSAGHLTRISYPDNKNTEFFYDGDILVSVQNNDGRQISYKYQDDCGVKRVSEVFEHTGPQNGQRMKISYRNGNTTVFETQGLDGEISLTGDNRKFTYHFDNFGCPADVSDEDGAANSYQFLREGRKNNKLSKTGTLQKVVMNRMEPEPYFVQWDKIKTGSENTIADLDIPDGFPVKKCCIISKNTVNGRNGFSKKQVLEKGTYTFSCYVKVEKCVPDPEKKRSECGAGILLSSGNTEKMDLVKEVKDTDSDEWTRVSATITIASQAEVTTAFFLDNMQGWAYFSCFQLEKSAAANKFNMLRNAFFEEAFNTTGENGWKLSQGESTDQIVTDSVKGKCARLRGNLSKDKSLMQTVNVSGKEGDVFVFGCSVKADAIPGRTFRVRAVVQFTDKTTTETIVNCNPYVTEWQFVNGVILTRKDGSTTNKTYESIQIYLEYQKQQNDAFFTGLQLIRDDAESYVYDTNGNIVSAKTAAEQNAFTCNKTDLLSKLIKVTGSSFEYEYDGNKNMTAARNSEGVQYRYTYDTKGNPQNVVIHHDRVSTAVMAGKSYFIRQRKSGKYLDVNGAVDADGTVVQQYEFKGTNAQKWKLEDAGEGYVILKAFNGTGTRVLDIGTDANGSKTVLNVYANKDSQKFRMKPVGGGVYLITSKLSKDQRAIDLLNGKMDNSVQLQIWDQSEVNVNQQWYLEPAEYEGKSDTPVSGKVYMMRLRHSGQYMRVNGTEAGSRIVQDRYWGSESQMFLLNTDGKGAFFLEPANAEGKALSMASNGTLTLQEKDASDSKQKFTFAANGKNYCIKQGNFYLTMPSNSYNENAWIKGVQQTTAATDAQKFILEACSERMTAQYTYTATGRNVKTLTDARGFVTTNEYDSKERLLTGVTDAKGNKVTYTYDTKNDLLTGATASDGTNTVKLGYTYDEGDRLKTIAHNGFEYTYEYDFLGNQTRILAGGNALEEYDYLPSDGPLSEVKYATGEVLKNSYDKYEQIVEQKWNGTTVFRNVYDDYGNVFYHEDLENDRKIFFDYDMIQRMAGYRTTDGETARIQYDNKNRRTGMVHQIDDSKISTSCVFGEIGKAQAPDVIYQIKVNDAVKISYTFDTLCRVTRKTIHLKDKTYPVDYTFVPGRKAGITTLLLKEINNNGKKLSFTYDAVGNIVTISENGVQKVKYTYNALSELTRVDSAWENKSITYTYDAGMNMTSRKEYSYTTGTLGNAVKTDLFTYRTSGWKDQLISYNGSSISYDAVGNITAYQGKTLTWYRGSLLHSLTLNGKKAVYHYDSEGHRIQWKDLNGISHKNYWCGNKLMGTKYGDVLVQFVYGADKSPMMLKKGEKEYYYLYNSQNDVIGLIDSDGKQVVNYSYDAWGKQTGLTDTSGENIGKLNPFRYRAYCYDDDTKLYVTASRYYDPELCRFLCADNFDVVIEKMFSMNGKNLYVYCCNNPVNAVDEEGSLAQVVGAIEKLLETPYGRFFVFGVVGAVVYWIQCELSGDEVTKEGLCVAAISGGIDGAFEDPMLSTMVGVMGSVYLEYHETKDIKRAIAAGIYDRIVAILTPETYNAHVKNQTEEMVLSAFSKFFETPILEHGKSGVLDGVCGKPNNQRKKSGSSAKNSNSNTKKSGGKQKRWQSNKPAISRKMQNIGLPALR
ncbi:DNRLRE domain-containing protein [Fusicatenibacter sp.]